MLQPCTVISRRQFAINLTIKPPSGFEPANPRLIIGKQLNNYSFILARRYIKYLKYKLNMINKTYLHCIRTSDSVSSCHVMV